MSLFDVNEEEIAKAKNNGRVVIPWKDGEKTNLLIKEYKEKENLEIFVCDVVGGEHDGKEQALFFRTNNEYDKASGIRLLLEFFSLDDLKSKKASVVDMIGNKVETVASVKPKKEGEGSWVNFNYFKAVSDVPNLKVAGGTDSNIPF